MEEKIKTSALNHWMHSDIIEVKFHKKSYIATKFRYINQTKSRPPTFSLYCNTKKGLDHSKVRAFKKTNLEKNLA